MPHPPLPPQQRRRTGGAPSLTATRLERTARSLQRERDPWHALPVTHGLRAAAERLRAGDITGASTALATVELEAATLAATDRDGPWLEVEDLVRRCLRGMAT